MAFLAEQVGRLETDVVEVELGGVLTGRAELVEIAASFEARHVAFDDEQAERPCAGFLAGSGDRDDEVGQ